MDYTRTLDRLLPPDDGEPPVRHRTGTVDTVNSDGTVDVDFGGTAVADVAVLDGVYVAAGDVVQVAVWRGDLLVLGRSRTAPVRQYRAYTPTWLAASSNPSLGDGDLLGQFLEDGDLVHCVIFLRTGSTTSFGSGNYSFTLPVAAVDSGASLLHRSYGSQPGVLFHDGEWWMLISDIINAGAEVTLRTVGTLAAGPGTQMSPTVPFTWNAQDQARLAFWYQRA